MAEEIVRRAQSAYPDSLLPYLPRLSAPGTIACQLLGKTVAIMPRKALTIDE